MATPKPAALIRIHLADCGQDFLWWDLRGIDGGYEVVDCGPFQGWLWIGKRVSAKSVKVRHRPVVAGENGKRGTQLNYAIERIEPRTVPAATRKLSIAVAAG